MMLCLLATVVPVHAQHVWYNDPGKGDVMSMDVCVNQTATTTYYETLGWNQGGDGGGYTGIQSTPGGASWIFSVWNPASVKNANVTVVYGDPDGKTEPFGGEGTGQHYLNLKQGWKVGKWYRTVVRTWPSEDTKGTLFGMWGYDYETQTWTHHATFLFPVPGVNFNYGAMGFLENYGGTAKDQVRSVQFGNGWKRTLDGKWHAFTKGTADKDGQYEVTDNSFVLQTGGTPITGFKNPLTVIAPPAPDLGTCSLAVVAVTYSPDKKHATVHWQLLPGSTPQFKYEINVVDTGNDNKAVKTISVIGADTSDAIIDIGDISVPPSHLCYGVTVTDIFDQRSNTKWTFAGSGAGD
jgi:hypothetical protein